MSIWILDSLAAALAASDRQHINNSTTVCHNEVVPLVGHTIAIVSVCLLKSLVLVTIWDIYSRHITRQKNIVRLSGSQVVLLGDYIR